MNTVKKYLLTMVIVSNGVLYADVLSSILRKYKHNDIFICMGIHSCESPANALNIGFRTLHLIDENNILVKHARIIFPRDLTENVNRVSRDYHIHHGGIEVLAAVINSIDVPMTLFLSNHYFGVERLVKNNILDELQLIKEHPIKNHVIIIDYINHAGELSFGGVTLEAIQEALIAINSKYQFMFDQGGHLGKEHNALLIALVP